MPLYTAHLNSLSERASGIHSDLQRLRVIGGTCRSQRAPQRCLRGLHQCPAPKKRRSAPFPVLQQRQQPQGVAHRHPDARVVDSDLPNHALGVNDKDRLQSEALVLEQPSRSSW